MGLLMVAVRNPRGGDGKRPREMTVWQRGVGTRRDAEGPKLCSHVGSITGRAGVLVQSGVRLQILPSPQFRLLLCSAPWIKDCIALNRQGRANMSPCYLCAWGRVSPPVPQRDLGELLKLNIFLFEQLSRKLTQRWGERNILQVTWDELIIGLELQLWVSWQLRQKEKTCAYCLIKIRVIWLALEGNTEIGWALRWGYT